MSRQCTPSHDTVCKPCAIGSFSDQYHLNEECTICTKCDSDEYVLKQCTKLGDTVCAPCPDIADVVSNSLAKECLLHQLQRDSADTSDVINPSDVYLQDGNLDESYESSGEGTYSVVYEGSGVEEANIESVDIWPKLESSGETPEEEETRDNVTYAILPEGSDTSEAENTTVRVGVITIDQGVVLPGSASDNETEVVIAENNTTTVRSIIIGGGDSGIVLKSSPQGNLSIQTFHFNAIEQYIIIDSIF